MEPLSSDTRPVSVFVNALYSKSVQSVLKNKEASLRSLWDQVLEIASSCGKNITVDSPSRMTSANGSRPSLFSEMNCRPRVKHIVKLFQALRGTAVSEEGSSVLAILEVL